MRLRRRQVAGALEPARYYHSDTDLYRVEQCTGERALLEDCRTGVLIDVPRSWLRRLTPVRDDYGAEVGGPPRMLVA